MRAQFVFHEVWIGLRRNLTMTVALVVVVAISLSLLGTRHSPADIAQALEVARAAEVVIASHFTEGFAELDAMRAKYRSAPWYKDLHGNYTYMLLPYSETQLRELGGTELSWTRSTPFSYDPMPTLRADSVPQLWILGGEDYEAPSAETPPRLCATSRDRACSAAGASRLLHRS